MVIDSQDGPAPSPPASTDQWSALSLLTPLLLGASFLWVYWGALYIMAKRWTYDAQYSHGFLVPLFALYLLWQRREHRRTLSFRGSPWGLALVLAGVVLRWAGDHFYVSSLEALSLLICLLGICVLIGGWNAVRWAWPALVILLFMCPLPFRIERALAQPLQRLATIGSAFCLEVLGCRATAEGNVIWVNDDIRIGVIEACGGLSMLLSFFALSTAFALAVQRPLLDKALILSSAIPIALVANVARITLTGILYQQADSEVALRFFHDLAGWFMMLLALGMLWLELWVLSRLLIKPPEAAPAAFLRESVARSSAFLRPIRPGPPPR